MSISYLRDQVEGLLRQQNSEQFQTVHSSLHRYFQELKSATLPPYRIYKEQLCAGVEQDEEKVAEHRDKIQHSYKILKSLESLPLATHFCSDCLFLLQELKSHQDCIALQGILGEQLPFKLLLDSASHGNDEEDLLEPFVFQLFSHRAPVTIVHRALKAIVECALTRLRLKLLKPDLSLLENILQDHWDNMEEEKEWALFDTPDRETVLANLQLKTGSCLRSQEHEFVLGEELGPSSSSNRFFNVERYSVQMGLFAVPQPDVDKIVLWFPPNEALPGLMRSRAQRHLAGTRSHSLPLNCPSFVDPKGRFCLVEKLHMQVGGREWKAALSRYLPPVIAWLNWLKENRITPSHFKPAYIFFNAKQCLTAVKEMRALPYYDEKAIEAFAKLIAGEDGKLYQKILKGIDN
jgi:hypothetical protein